METIVVNGMPLHRSTLKIGAPVMLLAKHRRCNGTRLIITGTADRVFEGRILSGEFEGQTRLSPRITLDSSKTSGLPLTLSRLQFP